ncbi:MAG: hypothetical protein ACLTMG_05860 [Oscillospiraceae bacterium]
MAETNIINLCMGAAHSADHGNGMCWPYDQFVFNGKYRAVFVASWKNGDMVRPVSRSLPATTFRVLIINHNCFVCAVPLQSP